MIACFGVCWCLIIFASIEVEKISGIFRILLCLVNLGFEFLVVVGYLVIKSPLALHLTISL